MDFCPWYDDMINPIVFDGTKSVWNILFSYIKVVYSDICLKNPQIQSLKLTCRRNEGVESKSSSALTLRAPVTGSI